MLANGFANGPCNRDFQDTRDFRPTYPPQPRYVSAGGKALGVRTLRLITLSRFTENTRQSVNNIESSMWQDLHVFTHGLCSV